MSTVEWYFKVGDREIGPLTSPQLVEMAKAGQLRADDLVKKGSAGPWVKASQVKGLIIHNSTTVDTNMYPPIRVVIPPPRSDNLPLGVVVSTKSPTPPIAKFATEAPSPFSTPQGTPVTNSVPESHEAPANPPFVVPVPLPARPLLDPSAPERPSNWTSRPRRRTFPAIPAWLIAAGIATSSAAILLAIGLFFGDRGRQDDLSDSTDASNTERTQYSEVPPTGDGHTSPEELAPEPKQSTQSRETTPDVQNSPSKERDESAMDKRPDEGLPSPDDATKVVTKDDTPKSLTALAADEVLKANSLHYRISGFKTLRWGDTEEESQLKAKEFKLSKWDRGDLIWDETRRLIGYHQTYHESVEALTDLIRETFGKTSVSQSWSEANENVSRVVKTYTYIFPETLVDVSFITEVRPGSVATTVTHLYLYDRQYLIRATERALESISPGLIITKDIFDLVQRATLPVRDFPSIPNTTSETNDVRGILKHVQTKQVWRWSRRKGDWYEVKANVLAVDQVTPKFQRRSPDAPYPGYIGVAFWAQNFANSKDLITNHELTGRFVRRGLCELALLHFPSKDGAYIEKSGDGNRWYEWMTTSGVSIKVDSAPENGPVLRISMNPKGKGQL